MCRVEPVIEMADKAYILIFSIHLYTLSHPPQALAITYSIVYAQYTKSIKLSSVHSHLHLHNSLVSSPNYRHNASINSSFVIGTSQHRKMRSCWGQQGQRKVMHGQRGKWCTLSCWFRPHCGRWGKNWQWDAMDRGGLVRGWVDGYTTLYNSKRVWSSKGLHRSQHGGSTYEDLQMLGVAGIRDWKGFFVKKTGRYFCFCPVKVWKFWSGSTCQAWLQTIQSSQQRSNSATSWVQLGQYSSPFTSIVTSRTQGTCTLSRLPRDWSKDQAGHQHGW